MKYLYIVDSGDSWAIANDTPEVRTMLAEIDDLWEECDPPITINEIEVDGMLV